MGLWLMQWYTWNSSSLFLIPNFAIARPTAFIIIVLGQAQQLPSMLCVGGADQARRRGTAENSPNIRDCFHSILITFPPWLPACASRQSLLPLILPCFSSVLSDVTILQSSWLVRPHFFWLEARRLGIISKWRPLSKIMTMGAGLSFVSWDRCPFISSFWIDIFWRPALGFQLVHLLCGIFEHMLFWWSSHQKQFMYVRE